MSAAGTPSTDPWVILTRERARYEDQFKSLKPNNGIITGEQAKSFFLQSKLPPLVLGEIWALADTDADGKMNIDEFSIACKLINLKLRGFELPKNLPPSWLACLKASTPPAIPPLPSALVNPPVRPEPPKIAPLVAPPGAIGQQPLLPGLVAPLGGNVSASVTGIIAPTVSKLGGPPTIPTGVVPPMQATAPLVPPLIDSAPLVAGIPLSSSTIQPIISSAPLIPSSIQSVSPLMSMSQPLSGTDIPPMTAIPPVQSGTPTGTVGIVGAPPSVPINSVAPMGMVGMSPVTGQVVGITGTGRTSASGTPRASITSLERTHSIESVSSQPEWSVPHQTKLKYTQIFNTADRTRSGFLSGPQARNVMVQTKLPQNILAQIWTLSDMDVDGRLSCEEFVLAMHLCEQASLGHPPPTKLPLDLIPPSFRRTRTTSVSSQGSAPPDQDPASTLLQNSFEDKRKENFEKGQAELERRRKALSDQLRQEREERERKEREELEKKEKARLEAERKRLEEFEKQMREQQEKERLIEEEKKRQAEQREAARKEMERQRQLEWEKQRLQELQNQRQREQENVLKLKAKNQSLTIELNTLNDQVKELSQKICDTRTGVSNVKATIDGMRSTRDTQMSEMSQLKNQLKEQNNRLLQLSQEKIKLEARNKTNVQDSEQARLAFENKEVAIKNLKTKVDGMQLEIESKMSDIENNNTQLGDLKMELKNLLNECEQLYSVYEVKRNTVLEMKNANKTNELDAWKSADAWGPTTVEDTISDWPVDNWATSATADEVPAAAAAATAAADYVKYRALYEFVARNSDEISFQPGDIINVPKEQTGEPGWLAGEIRGHTGWFPEAYVELLDPNSVKDTAFVQSTVVPSAIEDAETKRLEGIAEVPEIISESIGSYGAAPLTVEANVGQTILDGTTEPEYYIANYPYQSQEPGDLTFNAGEVIAVIKKDGDWWTGKMNDMIGIFPSNYVQKVDVTSTANAAMSSSSSIIATTAAAVTESSLTSATAKTETAAPFAGHSELSSGVSAEAVQSALANVNAQADTEVSQISFNKAKEEANAHTGTQVVKTKKPEIASVIAPYQSTSPEQLSLARGQLIMIRKKTDSGWWEGELQAKGRRRQVGWFPASYVKVLNSSGRVSGRTTPVSTTRMQQEVVIDKVTALYPYTAGNPDELTFAKDDIISVTAREEDAWWRGELNGVSGLFPSNYVAPFTQSKTRWEENKKRLESINELIQTEKSYVSDMAVVHQVFEEPLRKSKLVPAKDIDNIFVNWQDILQCNKRFLKDLVNASREDSDMIGAVICKHLPEMNAYVTFCGKQLDSATLLQKLTENSTAFRDLMKKCQNNVATKGMPLSSFLIKPMQRITKYPLLINKILQNMPSNHPDFKNLEEALKLAERFLSCINENVRLKENQDRLNWLQQCVQNDLNLVFDSETNRLGPRQLLHYGIFYKLKTNKEFLGFLFNDFFMLVQANKSLGTHFNFQLNGNIVCKLYKQPILIKNLVVTRGSTDNVESGTDSNRVLIIQDDKGTFKKFFLLSSVTECSLWMKRIETAKETSSKIYMLNMQNKRKTLQFSRQILLVTIIQGKELVSRNNNCQNKRRGKPQSDNIYCKVSLGNQEQGTDVAKESFYNGNTFQNGLPQIPSLVWNHSMQFQLRDVNQENLNFVVYKQHFFIPDEFLGRAELKVKEILKECQNHNGPITKKLILHQVESGEILVKLDLHLFENY